MKIYQLHISDHLVRTCNSLAFAKKTAVHVFGAEEDAEWKEETGHGKLWRLREYTVSEEDVRFDDDPLGCWQHEGHVWFDTDTANLMIKHRGKTRMLVVPEWIELMDPKLPCVQCNFQGIWKQILEKEEREDSQLPKLVSDLPDTLP